MAAFEPVTAVLRAFEVLRLINENDRATVTEIHQQSGLPKPTILRMIETLIAAGYVVREGDRPAYAATGKCLLLSNGFRAHDRLTAMAAPMLGAFRRKIGWPSDIGIFDGDAMVIAATSRDLGVLVLNRKIGTRTPLLLSALGRAYFAFCDDTEYERIIAVLRHSSNPLDQLAKSPERLDSLRRETRRRGFSVTDKRYLDTAYDGLIWGIGVPIIADGKVAAAMNVMFLRSAMSLEAGIAGLVPVLQAAAREIGDAVAQQSLGIVARPAPHANRGRAQARVAQ
jgi:IclR family transcriptional regulator, mhp operon transcriptional activator